MGRPAQGRVEAPANTWAGDDLRVVERRFKLYGIKIGKWKPRQHATVCRNCGFAAAPPPEQVAELVASAQPLGAPDPMGPAGTAADPAPDAEVTDFSA